MRFFTMGWWGGADEDSAEHPSGAYAVHLEAIRDRLPADLLATQESVSLHDARLRELLLTPAEGSLRLRLDSYGGDERFTLLYRSVESFRSTADPEVGLSGPHGYGDLGYDEVDVLPSGALEHRILFSGGIEFAVVFAGFELLREKIR